MSKLWNKFNIEKESLGEVFELPKDETYFSSRQKQIILSEEARDTFAECNLYLQNKKHNLEMPDLFLNLK